MEGKQQAKCEICQFDDNDEVLYGEWMVSRQLHVHYYCLLLSTNLPQRGSDSSGILGFLMRDIREEAAAARKRKCYYCQQMSASIQCHGCRVFFHLKCGLNNQCAFEFTGMYHSYCDSCVPMDDYKREILANPPQNRLCDICLVPILVFKMFQITYGDCCRRGFAHKSCMRRYALTSGYYLCCIWCRSKSFRDSIRLQSVFVPDRDAMWEKQRNAYRELHDRNLRCGESNCLCPNGRFYNKSTWVILSCKLCGCMGAHTKCLAGTMRMSKGTQPTEFKCSTCLDLEKNIAERPARSSNASIAGAEGNVNSSFYVKKIGPEIPALPDTQAPIFSDDDDYDTSSTSNSSNITVIASQLQTKATSETPPPNIEPSIIEILDSSQSQSPIVSPDLPELATNFLDSPQSETEINSPDSPQPQTAVNTPVSPEPELEEDPNTLLVLKRSFRFADEPFFYLVIYEFEHGTCVGKCTGSCVLRFNDDDPRIQDKSQKALQRVKITPDDVWCRDKDTGIFGQIDKFHQMLKSKPEQN
ncbi:pineapple eye protein [Drosophila suzukii]|uniref:Pineapple eye protein n=1 Tax=Drosophila suzukii TaxID=28584 RepID=A0AB39Z111_DROSZ